jgi:biopolymer transport protein ExbB
LNHLSFLKSFANSGGDWVIYLLIAASVWSVAVIIERFAVIARQSNLRDDWKKKAVDELKNVPPQSREQELQILLDLEKRKLEKRLLVLGTLGNNAPFIGLLGTVLGVIRAFHDLAATAGGPEVVMQGLSEALIATAVGILVAIPCVAAYNYLQKRLRDHLSDLEHIGRRVIADLDGKK